MGVRYNRLFKLLIDKKIRKGELCKISGISYASLRKLSHDGNINVEVLEKICRALDCDFVDIMEYVRDKPAEGQE
jgi:DNA-binding Xre family transcriptional regulator